MHAGLVGWVSDNQVFPVGKVFVPQTVVWYEILVNFFWQEKMKTGKRRIVLRWILFAF